MIGLILGVFTLGVLSIGLGAKAFSATGLPLSKTKNLNGIKAKGIGAVCILLGLALVLYGVSITMPWLLNLLDMPK